MRLFLTPFSGIKLFKIKGYVKQNFEFLVFLPTWLLACIFVYPYTALEENPSGYLVACDVIHFWNAFTFKWIVAGLEWNRCRGSSSSAQQSVGINKSWEKVFSSSSCLPLSSLCFYSASLSLSLSFALLDSHFSIFYLLLLISNFVMV